MQPVLVIGIGGTGADIAAGVKRKMFNAPSYNAPIQLRWIDIDINGDAFGKAKELGLDLAELIPLDGFNIVDFVKRACKDDPYFQKWWDCSEPLYYLEPLPYLEPDVIHWFQKMCRRDRRLMLYYHYQKVRGILQKSLEATLSHCDENASPLVVLCASTCGGMSGIILDVAYLVQHISSAIGRPVHILGVFALESIFAETFMHAQEQRARLILNTVATIKEIQHFATAKYEFGAQGQVIAFDEVEPFDGYWLAERSQTQFLERQRPTDYFFEIGFELFEVALSGNWNVPRKSKYVSAPLDTSAITDWSNLEAVYNKHSKNARPSPHISREFDK